jgi:CubicO group peptidase (beta-lactamase class C family)
MEENAIKILRTFGLSEEMVQGHVFRPEHLTDAVLSTDKQQVSHVFDQPLHKPAKTNLFYHLNTEQLRNDLHDLLQPCTVGYSMQLRRAGRIIFNEQSGFAKMPGEGGPDGEPWTMDTPMHVASVSKLITAMALTKLLKTKNISVDAPIWPYLPPYWVRGDSIETLTFRHLLSHKSGLVVPQPAPGPSDFQAMKNSIAHGIHGMPAYININFGLMRILISTIDAPYLFNLFPIFNIANQDDAYWDTTTIAYYSRYVDENIFVPLGISSSFLHTDPNALAYPWPAKTPGFNSSDLSTMSGCAAWHLSVNDLLTIMAAFRRRNIIVDPTTAEDMLDQQFGIDVIQDTKVGRLYAKGGFWGNGMSVEQSNVYFLPGRMELAILANSPFCQPNAGFMGNVLDIINKNMTLNLVSLTTTAVTAASLLGLINASRKLKVKDGIKL